MAQQEMKTSKELIAGARKLLNHAIVKQRQKSGSISENIPIKDLSLGYLMMLTWEELREYCGRRGVRVEEDESIDGKAKVEQEMIFLNEARKAFELLNKFCKHTPLEYLRGVGNYWYRCEDKKDDPLFLEKWLPKKEWLQIFKKWFLKDFKSNLSFNWDEKEMINKTQEFCRRISVGEVCWSDDFVRNWPNMRMGDLVEHLQE